MDELEKIKNMTPEEANAYLEELNACEHDCSSCSRECASKVKKPAKRLIAVMSGKGGTGKSAVTALLAMALKRAGQSCAILDADIACPSVPQLFGLWEPIIGDASELDPVESAGGIPIVSMALIAEDAAEPVIWPGKDLAKVAVYLMTSANWPQGLDTLLIDMPSGAGDIPLEYYTTMPMDYSLCVAEGGEAASGAILRAINLAEMLRVPVLGIVENFADSALPLSEAYKDVPVVASLGYDPALRAAAARGEIETVETSALDYLARAISEL